MPGKTELPQFGNVTILPTMITVRFPDSETEAEALGFLAGRFSFKSYDDGATIVPEAALGRMAAEGIRFTVEGRVSR